MARLMSRMGLARPNLPTPTVTLASFDCRRITTAQCPSCRDQCVLCLCGVSLACLLSDSQVNGSHGLPIEFGDRVTDIRLVDCDGDVTCDREDGDTLDSSDAGAVRRL